VSADAAARARLLPIARIGVTWVAHRVRLVADAEAAGRWLH